MRVPLRRASLTTQLTVVIATTLLLALVLVELFNLVNDVWSSRAALEKETEQIARVVGHYSIADLDFGTPEDAEQTLTGLGADPSLLAAVLYDGQGNRFAQFRREDHDVPLPASWGPVGGVSRRYGPGWLEIARDIDSGGERLGTIVLRVSTEPLRRRVRGHIAVAGAMTLTLFALATVIAILLQRAITRPLEGLTRTARRIARSGERSVRFEAEAAPEITVLADAFEHMVSALDRQLTEREAAEAAQRRYADRLKVIHDLEHTILLGTPVAVVAEQALASLAASEDTVCACVVELDRATGRGTLLARHPAGVVPDAPLTIAARDIERMRIEEAWTAPVDRCPIPLGLPVDAHDVLVVPLRTHGELLGALVLGVSGVESLDEESLTTAQEIAQLLALAIQQQRLSEEIARHTAELEQRVAERTSELAQTNRELQAFGYSVAHDLRAPLRAMSGFAEALEADHAQALDPQARDYLDRIVAASHRMDVLIRDLLAYSQLTLQEIAPIEVSLDQVLTQARSDLDVVLREADVTVDAPLGAVVGHHGMLVQVLENLLSNAAKFVKPDERARIRVRSERRGERVRVWVEDEGIGIAPVHYDRIFRVFERLHTTEHYPGTGIGLAIVKRGIERLGGAVGLESEPGVGSRLWFELPAPPTRRSDEQ